MAHRPMYCTDDDNDDCTKFNDRVITILSKIVLFLLPKILLFLKIRVGFPFIKSFGLEDVFYKYGVDGKSSGSN